MLALRRHYADFLTSGINLVLLFIGLRIGTREGWLLSFSLVACTSFFAWMGNIRRYRSISDTPTARTASAPQGYVEFFGRAEQYDGFRLTSRLKMQPCLWYRYEIERRDSRNNWETIEHGDSQDTFLLTDETGKCAIDPDDAEVITTHKQTWSENDYRYTEYLLLPQDNLYAIGEHVTLGGANSELNMKEDVAALLAEWKKNKPQLLARFDLNRDGEIDLKEWELARRQATREVIAQHREIRLKDGVHILRKPADGRLFMISNLPPDKLARKYWLWAWAHLVFMLGAVGGVGYALTT
jgi:hypothetical protein